MTDWDPDTEIERKFVVDTPADIWPQRGSPPEDGGTNIVQGYLFKTHGRSLRIRLADDQLTISLKWPRHSLFRREKEASLPSEMSEDLLRFCEPHIVRKARYPVVHGDHLWTVDIFSGANEGLVIAEAELLDHRETLDIPRWASREVTEVPEYYNDYLAEYPYSRWTSTP